ncbi:hypothetical protein NMY22_g6837 [Coprinellus aureogranulatus]|nr:hypothetical protein NMY22_g6837 [Coprinellus aureogranulatus]
MEIQTSRWEFWGQDTGASTPIISQLPINPNPDVSSEQLFGNIRLTLASQTRWITDASMHAPALSAPTPSTNLELPPPLPQTPYHCTHHRLYWHNSHIYASLKLLATSMVTVLEPCDVEALQLPLLLATTEHL